MLNYTTPLHPVYRLDPAVRLATRKKQREKSSRI